MNKENYIDFLRKLGFNDPELRKTLKHANPDFPSVYFNCTKEGKVYFTAYRRDQVKFVESRWNIIEPLQKKDEKVNLITIIPKEGFEEEAFKSLLRKVKSHAGITSITLRNFKGIGDTPVTIPLRPITLLFGANSAGKSTIFQALIYLREVLERKNANPDRTLAGGEIDLGGFKSLVHKHDEINGKITIRVDFTPDEDGFPNPWPDDDEAGDNKFDRFGRRVNVILENLWLEVTTSYWWISDDNIYFVEDYQIGVNGKELIVVTVDGPNGKSSLRYINWQHPVFDFMTERYGETGLPGEKNETDWRVQLEKDYKSRAKVEQILKDTDDSPTISPPITVDESVFSRVFSFKSHDTALIPRSLLKFDEVTFDDETTTPIYNDFKEIMTQVISGTGQLILGELQKLRYIGPIRKIVPRGFKPIMSPDESRWADGMGAWDLILDGWDDEDRENMRKKLNDYFSNPGKLNLGYTVERRDYLHTLVNGPEFSAVLKMAREYYGVNRTDEQKEKLLDTINALPRHTDLVLKDQRNGTDVHPQDMGMGVSQVLPVVVGAIDTAKKILVVEQPELHVHPAVQCALGDVFTDALIANEDRIFLLETHSEHLILRLLRRIRETAAQELPEGAPALRPNQVGVLYFEATKDGVKVTEIPIDETGEFTTSWPKGFFDERIDELR